MSDTGQVERARLARINRMSMDNKTEIVWFTLTLSHGLSHGSLAANRAAVDSAAPEPAAAALECKARHPFALFSSNPNLEVPMPVHFRSPLPKSALIVATFCFCGCGGAAKTAAPLQRDGRQGGAAAGSTQLSFALKAVPQPTDDIKPQLPAGPLQVIAGDPNDKVLAQVRLVPSSCENLAELRKQLAESQVREMRQALKDSFKNWHDAQPGCWEMYREEAERARHPRRYRPLSVKSAEYSAPSMHEAASGISGDSMPKGEKGKAVRSASGTNNQIAGVDEADIVKHDGTHVYFSVNGALRIATIDPPRVVSVTPLSGQVREMFVEGHRAVVYTVLGGNGGNRCTYGYDCQFAGDGSSTTINVFDIANREEPKLVRQIGLSGSLMAARRIGNAIHTVVADGEAAPPAYPTWPSDLEQCGVQQATVKQRLKRLEEDNERLIRNRDPLDGLPTITEQGKQRKLCENLTRTPLADGNGFTSVVSFDLTDDDRASTTATVQSRPGAVFVSEHALYFSVTHQHNSQKPAWYDFYPKHDEVSDIHKFRLGERPELTRYAGSGVVPGHVLNQFAMDEWYGLLRIATTRGRVPDPKVESQVSILADTSSGNLIRTGAVEHLAPGEDIRSVRFDNDRGYVVTFKKTDPLLVLDLRRPDHPRVLGELKIPGSSTYMHRIDSNHLLSIGLDANDHGDFAFFDGVILQLFDVTNPTDPQLMHKEIGTRGSSFQKLSHLGQDEADLLLN